LNIVILKECGYEEAALGFSLSYKTDIERAKQIMPKFAFGKSGENKFLESIQLWVDIDAPRFWWQEFDTYRVGISKNSESTMHSLCKDTVLQSDFERPILIDTIDYLNQMISQYKTETDKENKKRLFLAILAFLCRPIPDINLRYSL